MWRVAGWLLKIILLMITAGAFLSAAVYVHYAADLPDYSTLVTYRPATVSRVYAADGTLLTGFARENRVFMPIEEIPPLVRQAFISAEDRRFYSHKGIDWTGIGRAVWYNTQHFNDRKRSQGGSSITQQVIKNMLLGNERSLERKIKEAILALRLEQTLSKDKILELYLNDIFLGAGSYGVHAAAAVYFNKPPAALTTAEAAFLAALPKAPNTYNPLRNPQGALLRRNAILRRMNEDGVLTPEEMRDAVREPIKTVLKTREKPSSGAYLTEEVRRQLLETLGDRDLYSAGLTILTTLEPSMQEAAAKALRDGLQRYDRLGGWRGALANIDADKVDLNSAAATFKMPRDVPGWHMAVVTKIVGRSAVLRVDDRPVGNLDLEAARRDFGGHKVEVRIGDLLIVESLDNNNYALRQVPKINGAIAALDPRTGRVLAMQGGFSYDRSEFNRVSQALRQPGSLFKPIVYSAALDAGYTPITPVSDDPITLEGGNGVPWSPENFDRQSLGTVPMRIGLERSRNLMTVRIAADLGSKVISDYAKSLGVSDKPVDGLSAALGSGETTLLRMMSAYAVFASGGYKVNPVLTDLVADRYGRAILRGEQVCNDCTLPPGKDIHKVPPMPNLPDHRTSVLSPLTAFQMTDMLTGVVKRGTAKALRDLNLPLAAKTGTTNDAKDVWLIAYTPELVVGCYLGYDEPQSLGRRVTAGELVGPVVKSFLQSVKLKGLTFNVPSGLTPVRTDPYTGSVSDDPNAVTVYLREGDLAQSGNPAPVDNQPVYEQEPSVPYESNPGYHLPPSNMTIDGANPYFYESLPPAAEPQGNLPQSLLPAEPQ